MSTQNVPPSAVRFALALMVAVVAACATSVGVATAAAPQPCWKAVVDDWSDGRIAGSYPIHCYREALRRLPADVRLYSSASDDIRRALSERILTTRRPAGAPSSEGAGLPVGAAVVEREGFPDSPLILAGALAAVVASLGIGGSMLRRRFSRLPHGVTQELPNDSSRSGR